MQNSSGSLDTVYKEMAEGVQLLTSKIGTDARKMYVGLDGRIIGHLMAEYCERNRAQFRDDFGSTVQISSKYGEADKKKFFDVLDLHPDIGRPLYAIDLMVKTGGHGKMIKDLSREFFRETGKWVPIDYTVLYDPECRANVSVYKKDLPDESRLDWLPSMNDVNAIFKNEDGSWRKSYEISERSIGKMRHVRKIEDLL